VALALIAASLLEAIPHAPPRLAPPEGAGPYPSDWFGAQRAFPGDVVDQEAYLRALEQTRVERAALPSTMSGPVWTEAGPFNVGGRVTALAVVPGGVTAYLGAAAGGVWKSTDAGVNWDPIFDWVPSIGAVALDPSDPSTVYVGTGEANAAVDNYDGAGLFRSRDGGVGWEYLGLEETRRIARVAVDPTNSDRIFVAAMGSQYSTGPHRGLYRSENGGQSWTEVLFVNDSTGVCDVVVNPAHPETVYCASWERIRRPTYRRVYGPSCGIWRSVDHGATWTRLQSGLPAPSDDVGRIGLAIAASRPSTVYAQILGGPAQSLNGLGLYRTTDGGATWTRRDTGGFTGIFGGFGWYFGDMAVDPTNPDKIYCLGVELVRSLDGGATFTGIRGEAHVDQHALWIDPTNPARMCLGNDGGFYATTAGGPPWLGTADLPITQFYAGTLDASNPARLLGGTQDNGSNATFGSPSGWYGILGGDGFYCAVNPTNSNNVFAEWQFASGGQGPQRSVNGGSAFSAPSGFVASDRYNWSAPFIMDPSNPNVLLAASHRVYKSTNNGIGYVPVSGDLTRNIPSPLSYTSSMSTLEIASSNPSVYYAGTTDGKVWRSLDGGGLWTDITAGLPVRWVTRVSADPANASVVYVTLSGYSQDEFTPHVYRSTNAGDTWTGIQGNLPDVPANDLLVDPANPSRLYLATDVGVFTTQDLGAHWYPLGLGLPAVPVVDLTLHHATRTLVAATHGRSQWKLDLGQLAVGVGDPPAAARMTLHGPSPNPSRGEVRFVLEVSRPDRVAATVYDALGRRVATLRDVTSGTSRRVFTWDGRDESGRPVRAGAYYLHASLGGVESVTRRIIRLD
jgi:photosystem II stability/assembly factor-like uncharacterized protein